VEAVLRQARQASRRAAVPARARPEDVVEEGDVTMGGPGGAPAEEGTVEERREHDRSESG